MLPTKSETVCYRAGPKCLADGGHHRSGTSRAGVSSDVNFLLVRKAIQRE